VPVQISEVKRKGGIDQMAQGHNRQFPIEDSVIFQTKDRSGGR
jgi:hypothetical protein